MKALNITSIVTVALFIGTTWLHAQDIPLPLSTRPEDPAIEPSATSYLVFVQQPTTTRGGDTIAPAVTVQLKDSRGNNLALSGVAITITKSSGTGTLIGTTKRSTDATGLAKFDDLRINLIGSKRLTAAATGYTSAISNSFTIVLGPAFRLRIQTEPSATATAGAVFAQQPVIYVEDEGGNRVTTDNSTIVTATRLAGEGTLQGITTATSSSGIATFSSLSHTVADTITILFSSGTLVRDTSRSIIISPAAVARLAFVQQPMDTMAGAVIAPPVTVTLTDAYGNPVKTTGTSVIMALNSGTGALSGMLTKTTTSGLATFNNLSINLTGDKTLRATSGSLTAAISDTFTISPRPAKKLVFVQQPTAAVAGASISPAVTVQIRDSLDNIVPTAGISVTMALSSGTGILSGTLSHITNSTGLAAFDDLSLNLIGSKVLAASSPGLTSASSSAFTISAGPAAKLTFTQQPTHATAGMAISPAVTVQLRDAFGNIVRKAGDSIAIALASGTGTLSGTTAQVTNDSGRASFGNLSINRSGSKTLYVTGSGLAATVSDTFSIAPAAAIKLAFTTDPGGGSAGTPFAVQPVITLEDAFDNPVVGMAQTVTLAIQYNAGPEGTLLGTKSASVNQATGRALFSDIAIDKAGAAYTLTATGSTISTTPGTVISGSFQITAGAPAKVRVENAADGTGTALGSQNVTSGTSIVIYAISRDSYDNFVANVSADAWRLDSITAGVSTADLVAGADRKNATFTGRLTGSAIITVTKSPLTPIPSGRLTVVVAGTPSQIRVESAANGTGSIVTDQTVTSGGALTVYAVGRDAAGNFLSNLAADSWNLLNKTGGVLDADLVSSADRRSATFTGSLIGTARIQAAQGTLGKTPSGVVTVVAGPAATIAAAGGTPQSATVGSTFAARFIALVHDAAGNPARNVLVTWTPPVSGPSGTFSAGGSSATTDSNGRATSGIFTANIVAGRYTVVASLPSGAATAIYDLTNAYGTPARIATSGGSPQTARVSRQFPLRLDAVITDSSGNFVGGILVTFTAPASGASGTFPGGGRSATVLTDSSGVATAPAFTANNVIGSYQVTATTSGVANGAAFDLKNIAGFPGIITQSSGTPQSTSVGTPYPVALSAIITDSSGNRLPGISVTFTAPASGASGRFHGVLVDTVLTDASGRATASSFTANTQVGSFTVVGQISGFPASAPFQLTNQPGLVDTFLVDAAGGGALGTQVALQPFNIRIRAADRYGNVSTGFNGTTDLTSNGALSQASPTTAQFTSGVLASHTVAMKTAGRFILMATRTGGAETGRSDSFNVVNPPPVVSKIFPTVGRRGQSLTVTVQGSGFLPGVTTVSFGDKVATSTVVNSGNEMIVSLDIDTTAATGSRDVLVFNGLPGGGIVSMPGGFTVINNPAPLLTAMTPDTATVLHRLTVVLTGENFFEDATHLNAGPGILINGITFDSTTRLFADISIVDPAAGGIRRISLANSAPGGGVSDSLPFRIGAPPTPYPMPLAPGEASSGVDTTITFRWQSWLRSNVQYYLEVSTTPSFASLLVSDSTITDTARTVARFTRGSSYYWRVTARNSVGASDASPTRSFSVFHVYPSTISIVDTVWYPRHSSTSEYQDSDYRLVGLPGNCNIPLRSFLPGSHGSDWVSYWDTGASSEYLVAYDGSATFNFTPGRAFWILNKGPMAIRTTVPTLSLDSSRTVTIPLHTGWNLITNPFHSPVQWSAVKDVNGPGTIADLWEFNGTFTRASNFKPCVGYLFDNADNRAGMRIPLGYAVDKVADSTTRPEWRIGIQLSSGNTLDGSADIGISPLALEGRDPLDLRMPRGPGQDPGVYFQRAGWDASGSVFATDIRPCVDTIALWPLTVRAHAHQTVHLTFTGVRDVPPQYQVVLMDGGHARSVNLRETPQYDFSSPTPVSQFSIAVGTEEAVQKTLNDLVPKDFALEQNFPNPFNPKTVISSQLPAVSEVRIVIYDLLGREITVLVNEQRGPGRYQDVFDAGRLASGMYICRMTAGKFSAVAKMLLLK